MAERILIVDDDGAIRRVLRNFLTRAGYHCTEAADAAEARRYFETVSFALVLCDVMMPGESGIDLARFITANHPDSHVIIVTAVDDFERLKPLKTIDLSGIIIKPFSQTQVRITVSNALHRRKLELENRSHRQDLERLLEERSDELKESQDRFTAFCESSKDAMYIVTRKGRFVWINRSAGEMFGYRAAEMESINIGELYQDPTDRPKILALIDRKGFVDGLKVHMKDKDDRPLVIRITTKVWKDQAGNIAGYQGILRDITRFEKTRRNLMRAHRETKELIKAIPSMMIEIAEDGRIRRWNRVAEQAFGISAAATTGKPLSDCGLSLDLRLIQDGIARCREYDTRVLLEDVRFCRHDKSIGFMNVTLNPIRRDHDRASRTLLMATDVTEQRILESQLSQAQKLESIGQLAAGIAHEINTPIQYVGDNTRFLDGAFRDVSAVLKRCRNLVDAAKGGTLTEAKVRETETVFAEADLDFLSEEIPEAIRQSLEGVDRVAKIVRSMKEFSHPGTEDKTAVDINKALENTITVARNEWKYVAEMETRFDPQLPLVSCLPAEVNQVFLNMIINAAHSIADVVGDGSGGKGTIRIQTRPTGDGVEIRISDTGTGIAEEIRHRVFDPFFTTKEVGRGTGQGLAISHSVIVDKHGGGLEFETETGKGTTFVIRLPVEIHSQTEEAVA